MAKVTWIGLGVMGFPMAGHLMEQGHDVTIYNRTTSKAESWRAKHGGGTIALTPCKAAMNADIVFSCVGNDDDLRSVTIGENGAFQTMSPGTVFVDHSTASATLARQLSQQAEEKKFSFIDAPISGGQSGAENGSLTVMCGGNENAFHQIKPVIKSYAHKVSLLGPSGSGQLTKMVNQIAIAGLLQGLAEAINFAEQANLDVPQVIDTISKGAAQSWQMENRWETMLRNEFDFGFAVDWMRKDLRICFNEAQINGAQLPITEIVDGYYADVQKMGGRRWDTSSLIARLHTKRHNRNDKE